MRLNPNPFCDICAQCIADAVDRDNGVAEVGGNNLDFFPLSDADLLQKILLYSSASDCRFVNDVLHRGSRSVIPVFSKKS